MQAEISQSEKTRIYILYIAIILMFGIIIARLYSLATGNVEGISELESQYSRKIALGKSRGYILSEELIPLGADGEKITAVVLPHLCRDKQECAEALARFADCDISQLLELMHENRPFCLDVKRRFSEKEWLKCYSTAIDGSSEAIHIVGYDSAEGVGVCGLKRGFDEYLSTVAFGSLSVEYASDAKGGILTNGKVSIIDNGYGSASGVVTTIKRPLQQAVEVIADSLIDEGAIVVLDTSDNAIIASVSRPSYAKSTVASLLDSKNGEFINRAISGFAPGSIFKTAVAVTALERDAGYFDREYVCEGYVAFGDRRHYCHRRWGHGRLSMAQAFAYSCNCYFIKLACDIGLDEIFATCQSKLGIGVQTLLYGIGEYSCNLPMQASYPPSMTANCAIGQGEILLTPLEVARMMSVVSTGKSSVPYIVRGYRAYGECRLTDTRPSQSVLKQSTVDKMKSMLLLCVSDGTGKQAMPTRRNAGGKTATAQTEIIGESGNELNHIWFAGVYPIDDPKIAVAVLRASCEAESDFAKWAFRAVCEEYELLYLSSVNQAS